jgi:hypothetical protein
VIGLLDRSSLNQYFVFIAIKLLVDIILRCCFMFGLLFMKGYAPLGSSGDQDV